ncbi:pirin family protein [Peptoniphilus sp. MSJ-1]|uniref:Pirin family protein n=1 Tax=Peptoniphilus ovalis TaxID=2841503 RepID=A0ABS6FGQ8_9FIRM|nr:pirin family protein [Peptoniphilus ovalis]MBU5668400.1 pirin family protein [Peptoniphilus ovalis]
MDRKIIAKVRGQRAVDGAGVSLVRVLGLNTVKAFDPILMLDSFDSTDPNDYIAGFPEHPHRGIETISYISRGNMVHKDSMGNEDAISDGEVQWMNAGSGVMHEEMLPASERMLGVQLWLNLPSDEKMSNPSYKSIKNSEIEEIEFEGGKIRLLSGSYKDHKGHKGEHLPLDYYDIHLEKDAKIKIDTNRDDSIMIFTLLGDVYIGDELIEEKTAVKFSEGDFINIKNASEYAQVLFISSKKLDEDIAWAGPIVMNTREELEVAFNDLRNGNFIKEKIDYEE